MTYRGPGPGCPTPILTDRDWSRLTKSWTFQGELALVEPSPDLAISGTALAPTGSDLEPVEPQI